MYKELVKKRYGELVKQMRYCTEDHSILECAKECPYWDEDRSHGYCFLKLMAKAADAIESLSKEMMDLKLMTCSCCEVQEENGT